MSQRKFITLSIVELEALFASSSNNKQVLDELLDELSHRKTGRAKKLLQKIEKACRLNSLNEAKVIPVPEREENSNTPVAPHPEIPISPLTSLRTARSIITPLVETESVPSINTISISGKNPSIVTDWDAEIANSNDSVTPNLKITQAGGSKIQNTLDTWSALEALPPFQRFCSKGGSCNSITSSLLSA